MSVGYWWKWSIGVGERACAAIEFYGQIFVIVWFESEADGLVDGRINGESWKGKEYTLGDG